MFKIKSLALILIITVSVSFAALSGCKSKSADTTGSTSSGQRDPQKMKEQITSGLKSLVSDGTITQVQFEFTQRLNSINDFLLEISCLQTCF